MYKQIRHSCFDLKYHLVLITKNKCPIIKDKLAYDLKNYIFKYFSNNNIYIYQYKEKPHYIHILFEGKPNLNLANFINGLKTNSSKFIRKEYPQELSLFYSQPYFWSNSYFIGNAHDKSKTVVQTYIKNQK